MKIRIRKVNTNLPWVVAQGPVDLAAFPRWVDALHFANRYGATNWCVIEPAETDWAAVAWEKAEAEPAATRQEARAWRYGFPPSLRVNPELPSLTIGAQCQALTQRGVRCLNPVFHSQVWTYAHDTGEAVFFSRREQAWALWCVCKIHVPKDVATSAELLDAERFRAVLNATTPRGAA